MKNIPRIYIDENLEPGKQIKLSPDRYHYLTRVMRVSGTNDIDFFAFNNGVEFGMRLIQNMPCALCLVPSNRPDPSNDIILYFAPIKKTDDLLNMATQMGVAELIPVITERTVAHHINWERMNKIVIEAAEQSNRTSIPILRAPIKFADLDFKNLIFADERFAYGSPDDSRLTIHDQNRQAVLVGPEGGFADAEFAALDANGAIPMGLGRTILRAEVAGVVAISKLIK
jgi:16S rRNA (uracil1498-N3)-methyltransferase